MLTVKLNEAIIIGPYSSMFATYSRWGELHYRIITVGDDFLILFSQIQNGR